MDLLMRPLMRALSTAGTIALTLTLALTLAVLSASPGLARRARGAGRAADNAPADAGAAVCRTRARDYASAKHADPGQERMFFERCMGR